MNYVAIRFKNYRSECFTFHAAPLKIIEQNKIKFISLYMRRRNLNEYRDIM